MNIYEVKKNAKESKKIGREIRQDYFEGNFEEALLEEDGFSKKDVNVYSHKEKKYIITGFDHFNGHFSNFTDPASIFEIYVKEVVEVVEYLGIQVKKTYEGIYPISTYVYMPYQIGKWNGDGYSYGEEWYNDMKEEEEDFEEEWYNDMKEEEDFEPTCDLIPDGLQETWHVSEEDYKKLSK